MGELVLLVVAAAWAAVLIPPLLRSRIENRPNSSVTDFRRQLNRLQSTVPEPGRRLDARWHGPSAGTVAVAPPGRCRSTRYAFGSVASHRHPHTWWPRLDHPGAPRLDHHGAPRVGGARRRSHGDPTGGSPRPQQHRQTQVTRQETSSVTGQTRRRRSNVLFMLLLASGSTLFLAATTKETAMLYVFAACFLGLCGYVYMLAQARQREAGSWGNEWMQTDTRHDARYGR